MILDLNMFSEIETPIMGSRYLSAVALAILFYDRCIHFDEEVEDIWSDLRERTWLKLMFLCGRYTSEILVAYTTAVMGGFRPHLTKEDCQTYIIVVTFLIQLSVIGTEGVVIYRLRLLWDRSRYATYAIGLMASFVAAMIIIATVFELLEIPGFLGVASFLQSRQCLFMSGQKLIPSLILEASVLMAWDIFNIFIFVTNTFATPYQCSQDVFSRFKRDGGRYFICLFVVRSMHLFMAVFGKESQLSAVPLAWALATIINARIFHRIGRDLESKQEFLC
ncbi:hypothetical protein Ac2012v2_002298 [Leucoagaricus gongylophorus]